MFLLEPRLPMLVTAAFLSGVLIHRWFFTRVEADTFPCIVTGVFLIAHVFLLILLYFSSSYAETAFQTACCLSLGLFLGLWVSILAYRAFFHPLRGFPGPYLAKLTKLWCVSKVIRTNFRWFNVNQEIHTKYGDYVRTGPRELSITDPAALGPILDQTARGPFYGALEKSIHTSRDLDFHRKRRKVWDNAFRESLTDFGCRVEEFTDSFLTHLRNNDGEPINIKQLALHYSYDVMSALAFGESMGFVEGRSSKISEGVLSGIQSGLHAIGLFVHVPYVLTIIETFSKLPGPNPLKSYNNWSRDRVMQRRKMRHPKPDIMGHLMNNTKADAEGNVLLNAESRLIIGAGSDTTATALSLAFIYLAIYPEYISKIRSETERAYAFSEYSFTRPLPILDSVVNEVLRLHPPVTFGSQRVTPKEGLQIGDVWIPPNAVVSMPPCILGRDPRNYSSPNSFIPERWTSRPQLVLNRAAFMPFLVGRYKCPGKNLALMELRSVISRVSREFDICFPDGQEWTVDKLNAEIQDHFTTAVPPVKLMFRRRKKL